MSYYTPNEEEVFEILRRPDLDTVKGRRDKAILELLYSSGLRRNEVHTLNIEDINFNDSIVSVRKGKMGKDRIVPVGTLAKGALRLYLELSRPKWVKDTAETALFVSERGRRLSAYMVYEIVKSYAQHKKISTHSIRHACATHMLKGGASLVHIQKLLGHSSLKTTQIYTRLMPLELQEMYRKVGLREEEKEKAK